MPRRISTDCIACGACVPECPVDCIAEGDIYVIDEDICIDCGACLPECPVEAFYDDEDSAIKNGELDAVNKNYEFFGQKWG